MGVDHGVWSKKIILSEDSGVHRVLRKIDRNLPAKVANLIDKDNQDEPAWQKFLLSSQLDMDRLDYLRRDSLFTGAGYGHFDWQRLLNTFEIYKGEGSEWDVVWSEKSVRAIEEYIFSRHYMYQNVCLHKTTRGFEKMLEAMWRRAKSLHDAGEDAALVLAIRDFWNTQAGGGATVEQYLAIEEFTVLLQIQGWTKHPDKSLSDLARRFLNRERFAMIEAPNLESSFARDYSGWEAALKDLVGSRVEYDPVETYCLRDQVKAKYHQPYFPETESDEQSVKYAIRVLVERESTPVEVSLLRPRLLPLIEGAVDRVRYYIPQDLKKDAIRLRAQWNGRS